MTLEISDPLAATATQADFIVETGEQDRLLALLPSVETVTRGMYLVTHEGYTPANSSSPPTRPIHQYLSLHEGLSEQALRDRWALAWATHYDIDQAALLALARSFPVPALHAPPPSLSLYGRGENRDSVLLAFREEITWEKYTRKLSFRRVHNHRLWLDLTPAGPRLRRECNGHEE